MTPLIGDSGASYALGAPLAAGGQGTVYAASAAADGRALVIKVAHEPGAGGAPVRLAALRLASLGETPGVGRYFVPVWDTGMWGDRPFSVLERLACTLEAHRERAGDPERVARALVAAMAALARAEVVHGDLKPSNVFVCGDDEAIVLSDVWSGGEDRPLSPGFSAPEAWRGDPPTGAADAYALGATLWDLWSGVPPACAAGPDGRPPTRAELAASGIPPQWQPAVAGLLAPDPTRRLRVIDVREEPAPRRRAWAAGALGAGAVGLLAALGARQIAGDGCPAGFHRSEALCVAADGRRLALVPTGRFVAGELDRTWAPDAPPHGIVLRRPVWFRTTEVTQQEFTALLGENPMTLQSERLPDDRVVPCHEWEGHSLIGPEHPVVCVSWFEAIALANAASLADGLAPAYAVIDETIRWDQRADGWRLPTEAEWEWAARGAGAAQRWAGAPTRDEVCAFANVRDQDAPEFWGNEVSCHDGAPVLTAVGSYAPNALGLRDMLGNVGEWTWDWYADAPEGTTFDPMGGTLGPARAIRGGAWNQVARPVGARYASEPDGRGLNMGFRLVRSAR